LVICCARGASTLPGFNLCPNPYIRAPVKDDARGIEFGQFELAATLSLVGAAAVEFVRTNED
jgi:hypothetical protein